MANIIAKIQLNPSYSSWQDRHNGIYLTHSSGNDTADITSDMQLEFIKSSLRQKIITVISGDLYYTAGPSKYALHDKISLDKTWESNKIIIGPDNTSVNGIQIGDRVYEFKGDLIEPGPPGPPGETPSLEPLEKKLDAKLQEFEDRFAQLEDEQEVVAARTAMDGSTHSSLALRLQHDFNNINLDDFKLLSNVDNYAQMEALEDVVDGSLCYVKNDDKFYKYKDGLWTVFETGGGGGGGASTEVTLTSQSPAQIRVALGKEITLNYTYATTGKIKNGRATYTINDINVKTDKITEGPVSFNPTSYLKTGSNTIEIQVTDTYGAKDFLVYEIDCINLEITSTFNHAIVYSDAIPFIYNAKGNISKTVHFKIDNVEIGTEVVETNNVSKTYIIPKQSHGVHKLEVYMTCEIGEETLTSKILRYEFISIEEGQNQILISSSFKITEVDQYTAIKIPYIVYNPASLNANVELLINNSHFASITVDRREQVWSLTDYPTGTVTFSIKCGNVKKDFTVKVVPVEININAKEEGLQLYLTSNNRINDDNKEHWTYKNISAEFNGFNWITDGWQVDKDGVNVMRVSGDAHITIPFKLFEEDFKTLGKTIEFEFAVRDVLDYDAKVISCMSGNRGLEIGCKTALFKSNEMTLKTQYKEDERVRISFSVQNIRDERLVFIYLNGVISGLARYTTQDIFSQVEPVNITIGSNKCVLDIYNIRVYENALTSIEALHNYIFDMNNPKYKIELFSRNNVFNEHGEISYNKLLAQLPCMTLIGELPPVKGSKRYIKIKYEDQADPSRNFNDTNVKIDVQGTSSQYYPKKNYKFTLNFPYMLRTGSIPEKVYCVKADYMESSHMHNTGMAKIVHSMYDELVPPQKGNNKIRTTIDGFPIAMFYRESDNAPLQYFGIYNFNNDKDDVTTFGYSGTAESWEICNNTSDRTLFKRSDYETIGGDGKPEWQNDFEARYPEDNLEYTNLKRLTDWIASTKEDVNKFKTEFENYFNLHYATIYYILTELFAMVDSRAKNMFLSTWDSNIWYPVFYDMDTCFGLNNEGVLAFDYNVESQDSIGSQNVFNGKDSVLWVNFERAFANEIEKTYNDLRDSGKLSYEGILNFLLEEQFNPLCEAQYNADAAYKYLDPLINERIETYLYIAQGNRLNHLKYWLFNRFNYMDSRYIAADYKDNYATFRLYTPSSWSGIRPSANFKITPYASQYVSVKYGSYLVRQRGEYNKVTTITAPDIVFNDTETIIYGASRLSSIGDISDKYAGTVDVSKATQLKELIVGSSEPGYNNTNLHNVSVGNNKLLRKIDVSNCPNLTQALELSECDAIEEVYAEGTAISTVKLPPGGTLKIMHLPDSVTSLSLINKPNISDLSCSFTQLNTLVVENSNYNPFNVLTAATNLEFVRFINLDCTASCDLIDRLEGYKGLNVYGEEAPIAEAISGKIYIPECSTELEKKFKALYPNVLFTIGHSAKSFTVQFKNYDGEILYTQIVMQNGEAKYVGKTPVKPSTEKHHFVWNGWDRPLKPIVSDTVITAVFTPVFREYTVTFIDSNTNTIISTQQVGYGEKPKEPPFPEGHNEWEPIVSEIKQDTTYRSIYEPYPDDLSIFDFKLINESTEYEATLNSKASNMTYIIFPNKYNNKRVTRLTKTDGVTSITDVYIPRWVTHLEKLFKGCSKLSSITIPNKVTVLGNYCFEDCTSLAAIAIPDSVTELGQNCFKGCTSLTSIDIPTSVMTLKDYCFKGCTSLTSIDIPESITSIENYCFEECSSFSTITIPNSVTELGGYCFRNCTGLTSITLPNKISNLGQYCLYGCVNLPSITIPDSVTTIGQYCLSRCASLTSITIPNNVTELGQHCFAGCLALTTINIPSNITNLPVCCFSSCIKLSSINIPDNVIGLGDYCFEDCPKLSEISGCRYIKTIGFKCISGSPELILSFGCNRNAVQTIYFNSFGDFKGKTITLYTENGRSTDITGSPWGASSTVQINYIAIDKEQY